jgi:predicted  nucleic acid-binding Zn-ribbon protein
MPMIATEIEKQNLEAHVEICAVRYASLEAKLSNLEIRMEKVEERFDKVEEHLMDIKTAIIKSSQTKEVSAPRGEDANPYKTMIAIGTTIIGVLITGIITLVVKLS